MISVKRKIFVNKVVNAVLINSIKMQLLNLSNSNDSNGTSNKCKSSKDGIRRKKDNPDKNKISILGGRMMKYTKGWELPSKIDHKHSIYARSFSGAKVRSMKDYVKPCVRGE